VTSIGSVIDAPAPTAAPLIAPITGLRESKMRSAITPPRSRGTSVRSSEREPTAAQVRAGAERLAGSRDDDGADVVIGVSGIERVDELGEHPVG
jgi:hypothetical protein